jgi:cytochrome P450
MTTREHDAPELFSPEFVSCPHLAYEHMREEEGGVSQKFYPGGLNRIWFLTRYEEVRAALIDPELRKDRSSVTEGSLAAGALMDPELKPFHRNLSMVDPPEHTRLRRVIAKNMTPRQARSLQEPAERLAHRLIDEFAGRGEADLIESYASPLADGIIGGLVGVHVLPADDWKRLRELGRSLTSPSYTSRSVDFDRIKYEIRDLVLDVIRLRREQLGEDVISDLIRACDREEMTEGELMAMVVTMVLSGVDSVTAFIGTALHSLLTHPDQLELLQAKPELAGNAVNELLRYDSGTQTATFRFAASDLAYGDEVIPKGAVVCPVITAAHRDPRHFDEPERLDVTRETDHNLAFGIGTHNCLGQKVGHMVSTVGITTALSRLSGLRLTTDPGELRWRSGLLLRSVYELPVRFDVTEGALR